MSRLDTKTFVQKAKAVYGDQYEYSKVVYKNYHTKVLITCPKHGDFYVTPNNFLSGHKCPTCSGRKRVTKREFILKSNKIHNNRYDYSKVEWKGTRKKVTIICPIHGEFHQEAQSHMRGNGCPKCYKCFKHTTEEFISLARKKYGDKYDYSKVDYKGNKVKVCIICPKHGEWWVTPNNFLKRVGSECPGCYGTPRHTQKEFEELANKKHNNKYDYSKAIYKTNKDKVCIICPEHGEFWQKAGSHLRGSGCPKCAGRYGLTDELFIEKSIKSHDIKYDYSKVHINKPSDRVCIICPKHGPFYQRAYYHMRGGNCPRCVGGKKLTKDEFIEKARAIHGNKYDYSKVEYKSYSKKVCIICPEHGEFWQVPNNHLFGAGCPACPQSSLEGEMRNYLIKHHIKFEQEKGFPWLRYRKKMFLDFYLPEYKIGIECQGKQHFTSIDLFGGEEFFNKTIERDKLKFKLCKDHDITLLYFSKAHIDYPYPVIESFSALLSKIKENL